MIEKTTCPDFFIFFLFEFTPNCIHTYTQMILFLVKVRNAQVISAHRHFKVFNCILYVGIYMGLRILRRSFLKNLKNGVY